MQMDGASLLALCKQHRLYQTPALNDKLYANFKGFTSLGGLESYTGLRALFLEGNALTSTDGVPPLPELRCLFLQQNMLTSLSPALAALPQLDTLNVSGNSLEDLGGLAGCCALRTLLAADNLLGSTAALTPLAACPALESVDLQNNQLEDAPGVLALLARLPQLKCLYLRGNPLVSSLPSYRKAVISALPGLTYLDDRPVFELERACAEAWAQGGVEAERQARAAYHERQAAAEKERVEALRKIREAGWRKRREALGLPLEGGDPDLEHLPSSWQPAEGESQQQEEPAELRAARERLAAYTAAKQKQGVQAEGEDQLPGLAEADMQALAEDRRDNHAALAAAAAVGASAAAPGGPNTPSCEAAGPGTSECCEVPEASITVTLAEGASACQHTDSTAVAAQEPGYGADGLPGEVSGTDSDDEGSASVAAVMVEDDEDCLAELD